MKIESLEHSCPDDGMVSMWYFQTMALALFKQSGLVEYLSPEGKVGFDDGLLTIENLLSDPGIQKMVSDSYNKFSGG